MNDLSPDDTMLDVRHVRKIYSGSGSDFEAIRDLDFRVADGEFLCIVGPSGAGKTTLLRCVAGLLDVTDGAVYLDGDRVTAPPEGLAVVFQEYGRSLFPWMTVRQNVELPLKEKRVAAPRRAELVAQSLEAVGLDKVPDSYPWQLSGGMQQRVAIARAVAYEPRILLMDEPFAAVDAQTRAELEDLVLELWSRLGVTVVFVTHDIDEAIYLGQRVLVLSNSPTTVLEDVPVELPAARDQLRTRSLRAFGELRLRVHGLVQAAKGVNSGAGQ
jgi:NitT/TauT family transport system ATP-binding protein